ncbi:hypothetical protein LRU_01062 [Ligilactobacillus ruminis SPM0211]|uniref:Uncharacterized protein n=1 Tax=Ligilactobacillus ruminis SPM0211 TaxID=1040964 RepID=F7R0H2_9LACO|nr:hypothetical protein LRU_01062 [Ligilactobacillus ruminis SPM0211]
MRNPVPSASFRIHSDPLVHLAQQNPAVILSITGKS